MANWIQSTQYDFLKKARLAFLCALGIILVGGFFIFSRSNTIFGMDFTGGFALNLELTPNESTNYKSQVEEALLKGGAHRRDFQIQVLSPANHVRILLGIGMEQEGRPFFQLPLEHASQTSLHPFQKNPRIDWVVKTLGAAHLQPLDSSLSTLHTNWTSMSGQMSDSMKNHALIGLLIALACIFIYLSFRFEYEFAAAALLCLFHDILITMGLIGIFHAIGIPVQIDLNTIAALMTIIGYSLNDTIIIFDRVREEMEKNPHKNLKGLVNRALNSTLSRTTITSGTTLLVLIALVAFGGASIFSFALVMTVGVFFGTLSSWFIASPLMLFFHRRQKISTV